MVVRSSYSLSYPQHRWWTLSRRRQVFGYLFLLPALLLTLVMIIYPLYWMGYLSMHSYKLTEPWARFRWIGLTHYVRLAHDPAIIHAAWVSIAYSVITSTAAFGIGLGTAMLLNNRFRLARLVRPFVTLPWAVPSAIAAVVWVLLFQSSFGVLNYLLRQTGFIHQDVPWLIDRGTALWAVIVASIWKLYPFNTLVLLAGLQAIPVELYEAVRVDGGTAWHQFRHITWPALSAVRIVVVLLTVVWTFREFELIYIMTGGGPARSTETLSVTIYQNAFKFYDFGYASALGVLMLFGTVLLTAVFLHVMQREFY